MLKLTEELAIKYLTLLELKGEDGLFKQAIAVGVRASVEVLHPENDILDLSDLFLKKYRVSGNEKYMIVSKCLRRAAHVLYREFTKDPTEANRRFLRSVK